MSKRCKFVNPVTKPNNPPLNGKLRTWASRMAFRLAGWCIKGELPDLPKFIAIGGPHTSNFDGPIAVACIWALGIQTRVMAKHTIFRFPFRRFLAWVGVFPVDRDAPGGIIGQVIDEMNASEQFILLIAPEGTRKKVKRWKTGFHRIAVGANVPIMPVEMDYKNRTITLWPVKYPTDDVDADIAELQQYMRAGIARHPTRE